MRTARIIGDTLALAFGWALAGTVWAADARRATFGTLPDGRAVEVITLSNAKGVSARILTYGALLQALVVPDARGQKADVVLGYDSLDGYLKKPNYFGSSVGRYANRIGKARFTLDGQPYQLAANDGPNNLHGGNQGFDRKLWTIGKVVSGPVASVTLTYTSPDGEEGFPGTMQVSATYALNGKGELAVTYRARTDKPTVVNLTNHAYFHLGGTHSGRGVEDHVLTIPAATYTPVDATLIPTGQLAPVKNTPFDFRQPRRIGDRWRDGDRQMTLARGYDHNWVVTPKPSPSIHLDARLADPVSGRVMELWSNQPGLQFYSGNFMDGTITGKSGQIYRQGDGLCLEPQLFPDTPNQPAFGSARLEPGQTYEHRILYRFSTRAKR
jgi:aldose 1-epimerase